MIFLEKINIYLISPKPILYVGRVYPAVMWDYFNNGASIRMINPQYFSNTVWRLCATLQVRTGVYIFLILDIKSNCNLIVKTLAWGGGGFLVF